MPKTWTAKDVEQIMLIAEGTVSLNDPVLKDGEDLETELGDILEDPDSDVEEEYLRRAKYEYLYNVVETVLPARERDIVLKRFGFVGRSMTLEEVGQEMNLTRERVRQLEVRALRRLRLHFKKNKLTEVDI